MEQERMDRVIQLHYIYKLWNRMASGSYFPPPVKEVEIPKKDGKIRKLGIPTISDRIGQMVVKMYLEPRLEKVSGPNSYRRVARSGYLAFSKKRRKSKKEIRKTVRKQLGYLERDLGHIERLLDTIEERRRTGKAAGMFPDMPDPYPTRFPVPKRDQRIYWVLQLLYRQQKYMYDEKVHSVADRITNIYQPYVRPIPRGKDRVVHGVRGTYKLGQLQRIEGHGTTSGGLREHPRPLPRTAVGRPDLPEQRGTNATISRGSSGRERTPTASRTYRQKEGTPPRAGNRSGRNR
jgi:hypothetical protein